MKRKASDTNLPTKHLIADAVGTLSFEAMSKLNCQQESCAKMAHIARKKAMRHLVAPRYLADLVLTPDYITQHLPTQQERRKIFPVRNGEKHRSFG